MDWKRIGKILLFPHMAVLILLLPLSAAYLIAAMVFIGVETVAAYISYALAAYTLTITTISMRFAIRRIRTCVSSSHCMAR